MLQCHQEYACSSFQIYFTQYHGILSGQIFGKYSLQKITRLPNLIHLYQIEARINGSTSSKHFHFFTLELIFHLRVPLTICQHGNNGIHHKVLDKITYPFP